jgi:hypothetical protein
MPGVVGHHPRMAWIYQAASIAVDPRHAWIRQLHALQGGGELLAIQVTSAG